MHRSDHPQCVPLSHRMHAMARCAVLFTCLSFMVGCDLRSPTKAENADDLYELVIAGDLESVRLSIDADKTLANAIGTAGHIPLVIAAGNGYAELVTYLLDSGATIDARTEYGTALHSAVQGEHTEVVRILLTRGANPHILDDWKQAPLHRTSQHRRDAVARMLTDYGADAHARDHLGRTPLHRCKSVAVAKHLVSRGADVNAVDDHGYTPLHWAATPREIVDRPTIEYLLAQGADVTLTDNEGLTPRELAARSSQSALIKILIAHEP